MGSKRPPPFDLSGPTEPPASPAESSIDAPTDLDFQSPEFRLDEQAGAVVTTRTGSSPTPPMLELPALAEEARAGRVRAPRAWPFYLTAGVVSALWALAPIMFAWGYRREVVPFANDPFALVVLGLLALGPMALVWLAAYVAHQGARLAAETRRAQILGDTLLQPAALAARGAGTAVEAVRREIELANAAAAQARDQLLALREVLAAESRNLVEATQASSRIALTLSEELGAQRQQMGVLANALDGQAAGVADAITRNAKMVAEASDLAETQIREAEAALTARAADLAAAAGEASDVARVAGEDLSRQVARLETAGQGLGDQVRAAEESLTRQRAALITVAQDLHTENEALAAEAESQRARLTEIVGQARQGVGEMDQTAARGAVALRDLIAEAGVRLRDLAEAAGQQRDQLSEAAARSLGAVSEVAASERIMLEAQTREAVDTLTLAAEQARRAADAHAQTVRDKIDQLGEAAFSAGQRADTVFESRLSEARGLIEQSARMAEDAGARAATQLTQGVATARETLGELERLLSEIDARISHLPADAEARAGQVRASLARGMEDLMASARKAAEETQHIDAAFQDRVRRNYDMLSEAVRLMGVVAGAATSPPPAPLSPAPPRPPNPPPLRFESAPEPAPVPAPAPIPAAEELGLRPRLRLTPTATDDEFKTVFEAAGGREPAEPAPEGWTWKKLLSSMDEPAPDGPTPDGDTPAPEAPARDASPDTLIGEIEAMGVDAAALLPRQRIDEIAVRFHTGHGADALDLVRRLAPAAVRRLSRRMAADRRLRAQVERFVRGHQALVEEAIGRGDGGAATSAALGTAEGRAYLLLDAALAEIG